jgi:hypothetical protein
MSLDAPELPFSLGEYDPRVAPLGRLEGDTAAIA